jgi:N6-adenosine-specific RNA methylase IME4
LIATKGKNAHKFVINHKINSFIEFPRLEHSKKPDIIRDSIVDLVGDRKRIELFARDNFVGWDNWGNDERITKKTS